VGYRVLLGLSGGIDSAVAAILLQEQGEKVEGVYIKMHDDDRKNESDYTRACQLGKFLGIKVHFHDLSRVFRREVYDYFVEQYRIGMTPNPCIVCNRQIKFGKMMEFADSMGIEKVATGHYARTDGRYLYTAADMEKDQSYFLADISPETVGRLVFPLGNMRKDDIREIAGKIPDLKEIAAQKESSEICFVDNDYTEILGKHMEIDCEGEAVDEEGNVVGTHKGYMHYTVGKRRGFTVRGAHDPHYVLRLDPEANRIVVGTREKLAKNFFSIDRINLFEDLERFECQVKVRYRTRAVPAIVNIGEKRGSVELEEPVYGLARGQFAVFYDKDRVLGGGVIV
jgi:tRNA-specific 2-thiouridylase